MELLSLLVGLMLLGILWRISSRRWRRWVLGPLVSIMALCLIAISPIGVAVANWGIVRLLPADRGEVVEAIVVLGRGVDFRAQRVEVAAQLWQAQRSPRIFVSGNRDAVEMMEALKTAVVVGQVLSGEMCSLTTEENAAYTASVLRPRGVRQILLVTDLPHMLRSLMTFRSAGFTVIPHVSPIPATASHLQALLLLREWLGLVGYAALGRFRPDVGIDNGQIVDRLANLAAENCQLEG